MGTLRLAAAIGLAGALAGCGIWKSATVEAGGTLTDRVWIDDDPDAARGTFRAFLSDGTLVMASCTEPYRLEPWRQVDDTSLAWDEDGRTVHATIAELGPETLGLLVHVGDNDSVRNYVAARSPVVCPDHPT